jgi:hypothetical protein
MSKIKLDLAATDNQRLNVYNFRYSIIKKHFPYRELTRT